MVLETNKQSCWSQKKKRIYKWKISVWKDPPSHIIRKLQIKITMRYHYTSMRTVRFRTLTTPNANKDVEQQECSVIVTLKNSLAVSYTTKHSLAITSSNHVLWCIPKGANDSIHTGTYTWISTEVLFIIGKMWKQSRCPSAGKQINKLVHSDNRILFSTKKKWCIKPWRDIKGT
jgi:Tfp pilus assembly protein PilV